MQPYTKIDQICKAIERTIGSEGSQFVLGLSNLGMSLTINKHKKYLLGLSFKLANREQKCLVVVLLESICVDKTTTQILEFIMQGSSFQQLLIAILSIKND